MLKGETVRLYTTKETGRDDLNRPVYEEVAVEIENVLIGSPTSEEAVNTLNLTGRRAAYTLGIPKGDTNDWENKTVEFWGEKWRTIGIPTTAVQELLPCGMPWGKNVQVERYE